MKIKIDEIPEEGLSLDICEEGSSLMEIAGPLDFLVAGSVEAHLDIGRVGAELAVIDGSLNARVATECSRCLKPIEAEHKVAFRETLLLSADGAGGGEGKERELSLRDMDYTVMEAAELDTNDILISQLVQEASSTPLCREDCRGLCHSCGSDLNAGQCGCDSPCDDDIDKRFAKLKDLKLK
ncbi:COG1399 protein, clustered with ribosomal protein L32p [hydrothermal vent metagenome]|uniref:COG1399 protein, clustered with ribosomal protein L32p n=1 Tax=hydrothermal vent metagenome TaxID=652676 RepID=A0A3B0R900_9ZZZZ